MSAPSDQYHLLGPWPIACGQAWDASRLTHETAATKSKLRGISPKPNMKSAKTVPTRWLGDDLFWVYHLLSSSVIISRHRCTPATSLLHSLSPLEFVGDMNPFLFIITGVVAWRLYTAFCHLATVPGKIPWVGRTGILTYIGAQIKAIWNTPSAINEAYQKVCVVSPSTVWMTESDRHLV